MSIYIYAEFKPEAESKSFGPTHPHITTLGPYIQSDKRHFVQQSRYTICTYSPSFKWCYAKYEEVVTSGNENQDIFWKFNIPYSERQTVLSYLNKVNIDALSLFGTGEALMETLAHKMFEVGNNK